MLNFDLNIVFYKIKKKLNIDALRETSNFQFQLRSLLNFSSTYVDF